MENLKRMSMIKEEIMLLYPEYKVGSKYDIKNDNYTIIVSNDITDEELGYLKLMYPTVSFEIRGD